MRIAYVCSSSNFTAKTFHRANAIVKYIDTNFDADIIEVGPRTRYQKIGRNANLSHFINVFISWVLTVLNLFSIFILPKTLIANLWASIAFFSPRSGKKHDVLMFYEPIYAYLPFYMKGRYKFFVYERTDHYPSAFQGATRSFIGILDSYCLRKADLVVCVSKTLAMEARIRGAKKVITIPNGIYANDFKSKINKYFDNDDKHKTIIYVGNLIYARWGVDFLLRAFMYCLKSNPDLKLIIVGEGPLRAKLEDFVRENGIEDKVEFKGFVLHEDLPKVLSQASIGVAPYMPTEHTKYAAALKILEYMAAGLPVVVTNVGEFINIVKKNDAGIVVKYDIEAFAKTILKIINDPSLRERMGKNGKIAVKDYDWNVLLKKEFGAIKSL
ncbi:glycosyltransferase family 4 protein [[Eubacterium] cellulosolvens]